MKFDYTIGNPPYNNGNITVYPDFIRRFYEISDVNLMIYPARWFSGGRGTDNFRRWVIDTAGMDIWTVSEEESGFSNSVIVKGGYCYSKTSNALRVNGHKVDTDKYNYLIKNPQVYPIVDKIKSQATRFLSDVYQPRGYSGIRTNGTLKGEDTYVLYDKPKSGSVKVWVSSFQCKTRIKYADRKHINPGSDQGWRVITVAAAGNAFDGFGFTEVIKPGETHTDSYINFKVESESEAKFLKLYLKTKFANFLLSLLKPSQHINKKATSWIPLVPLDKTWTDNELYERFGLTRKEIKLIEDKSLWPN